VAADGGPRWPRVRTRFSSRFTLTPTGRSDAAQTLYLDQFDELMGQLRVIATAVGRTM